VRRFGKPGRARQVADNTMTFSLRFSRHLLFMLAASALVAGCGDTIDVGGFGGGGGSGGAGTGTGGSGTGGSTGSGTGQIDIHLTSSTAPFTHTDGLSGQTPTMHTAGLKSLKLYRSETDTAPLTVFDLGADSKTVDFADGADTLVYTATAGDLVSGNFTRARVVYTWVKYEVAATLHTSGLDLPGKFDNLQVLSDDTTVDGNTYDAGHYEYVFTTGGMSYPTSGENAPVPEWSGVGGFEVVSEGGEWAYYFPVSLPVDPTLNTNLRIDLAVNMHESFRWQDETMTGYVDGVFDTTTTTFEPVKQFGANSFALTVK
jgi:hypothetical protein